MWSLDHWSEKGCFWQSHPNRIRNIFNYIISSQIICWKLVYCPQSCLSESCRVHFHLWITVWCKEIINFLLIALEYNNFYLAKSAQQLRAYILLVIAILETEYKKTCYLLCTFLKAYWNTKLLTKSHNTTNGFIKAVLLRGLHLSYKSQHKPELICFFWKKMKKLPCFYITMIHGCVVTDRRKSSQRIIQIGNEWCLLNFLLLNYYTACVSSSSIVF